MNIKIFTIIMSKVTGPFVDAFQEGFFRFWGFSAYKLPIVLAQVS